MLELLRKLFVYDKWAIDRSLATLDSPANARALAMLSHVLLAEKIWLTRLNGEDSSAIKVFEELSLGRCVELADDLHADYARYIESLDEAGLNSVITYRNTEGVQYQTPVRDILFHVGLHGVYHRGQIALMVRDGGGVAVGTDYILFTRQ